jgi:predicted transcriptional regulator
MKPRMIRMTDEEWDALNRLAHAQERDRSSHIRFLVRQEIAKAAA